MPENKKKQKKRGNHNTPLPNQAISAYEQSADPLGSYTGVTDDMINPGKNMPRRDVGGKIYMRVEEQPMTGRRRSLIRAAIQPAPKAFLPILLPEQKSIAV